MEIRRQARLHLKTTHGTLPKENLLWITLNMEIAIKLYEMNSLSKKEYIKHKPPKAKIKYFPRVKKQFPFQPSLKNFLYL